MVKDIYFLFALVEELDTCERSVIFDMLCHSNGSFLFSSAFEIVAKNGLDGLIGEYAQQSFQCLLMGPSLTTSFCIGHEGIKSSFGEGLEGWLFVAKRVWKCLTFYLQMMH